MRLVASTLVTVLVLAGCVTMEAEPAGEALDAAALRDPFAGLGDPLVVGHDHGDLAAHALASPTMSLLSHVTFDELAVPSLAFGEADLLGDSHVVIASLLQGFLIADVSDPARPRPVSYTPMTGFIADVKASESGAFVFLGIQLAGQTGIQAWNVAVRERPVAAGFFPMQGGCHMLAVHAGHLYCAPNDATVRIFQILETPVAVALVPVGVYAPKAPPAAPILTSEDAGDEFTHDMTVQDDPLTGAPVMYVSFWEMGMRVVDVSDPSQPVELGAWLGEGSDVYEGNVHTSMATLVDGRRIVVTVPEYATVPSVTVIDATDYAAMRALGVWAPKPAEAWADESRTFSTHNFQLVDGKVYLGMYHGGVWVLDVSTPERLARPTPIGYYLPAEARTSPVPVPVPDAPFGGGSPSVWDVVVKDGVILATDIPGGLYALQHAPDAGKDLDSFA